MISFGEENDRAKMFGHQIAQTMRNLIACSGLEIRQIPVVLSENLAA
jgi:hypothetical protein